MKIISICCIVFPILIPIQSQASTDNQPLTENADIQPKAFFKDTTIWPSLDIPICWENQTSPELNNTRTNRQLVLTALNRTWVTESLIHFIGNADTLCPSGYFSGVRISLSSTWNMAPVTHGLGKEVLNIHPYTGMRGVTLDFSLSTIINGRANRDRCLDNGKNLDQCIQFTAVHEFGHVLGLSHEQNRSDDWKYPPYIDSCKIDDPSSYNVMGNTDFTDYDPSSIMNYCRQQYWGNSNLSKMDKVAIKAYYGNIPTYVAETGVLNIPRVWVGAAPYQATLVNNGGIFTLTYFASANNDSKGDASYVYPKVNLPLLRFKVGAKVTNLYTATLTQIPGTNSFSATYSLHPDARPSSAASATSLSVTNLPWPTR